MYVTTNYIEEVDTPEGKAFLDKFKAKFPDEPYVNQEAANSYIAMNLYKQMVERAERLDQARRPRARSWPRAMSASTARRARSASIRRASTCRTRSILAQVDDGPHDRASRRSGTDIKPYWLGEAGCDLTKNDPSAQYTPSNPPPKN